MARLSFERNREVEQFGVALVALVERPDLGDFLDRLFYGEREVRRVRNELGNRVRFGRREAEDAADVLDCGARLERAEGDDLADAVAPVFLAYVLDDFAAAFFEMSLGSTDSLSQTANLRKDYSARTQGEYSRF